MEHNNENLFAASQLRPPTRIPSPGKLMEVSASAKNARSGVMPPPPINPLKRKTLIERGGEPTRPNPAPPSSRFGASHQKSFSSSTSSHYNTSVNSARHASFSGSLGPGARLPSAQAHRPQSAQPGSRMQRPTHAPYGIFAPSEAHQSTISEAVGRTCRTPFFSNPVDISKYSVMQGANESNDPQPKYISNWASRIGPKSSPRAVSFTALSIRRLEGKPRSTPKVDSDTLFTPSHIPKRIPSVEVLAIKPSPIRSPRKRVINLPFLTRDSNTRVASREHDDRITNMEKSMEKSYNEFRERMDGMTTESNSLREVIEVYKARVTDLDAIKIQLNRSNVSLQTELETSRSRAKTATDNLEDAKRQHSIQLEDLQRKHGLELEDAKRHSQEEIRRLVREHGAEMDDLKRRLETALENETLRRQNELQAATAEGELVQQKAQVELDRLRDIARAAEESLQEIREDLKRERCVSGDLRNKIIESSSTSTSLEGTIRSLRAHIEFLESDNKSQSNAFVDLETRLQNALKGAAEANEKLIKEETLRRKLHNQVQELKGNIRVFCRVRPALPSEPGSQAAQIKFPDTGTDSKEVEILGPEEKSSLGSVTTKHNAFSFDRVFTPESVNEDVFAEISQLVQSALDGYNVCIFCYGQTGSGRYYPDPHVSTIAEQMKGKTHTMSSEDGMITRAVHQIYSTAKSLEEKGWKYSMEGQFVEVYNENLNDLLGKADELDKKKHEIRHDMQKCKTTITDITTVQLDSPDEVESILRRASANRSVAATKANERSSRSHSVFILKLTGQNSTTGEKSEGTLNLVDLAGSERLGHSKAVGDRLKETQNINKSLSCLGDVIGALGQGKDGGHIPYRNSKLTYLLQFSLGGNSKTLMFVMISPLQAHLHETLTSLKFATKVHNTHIGTAKRQMKSMRDS